jgi:sterol 3beta-glucosyltransferase
MTARRVRADDGEMRIAILAAGTRGDIQPVVAIGTELVRRGHTVTVAVNDDLVEWVRRAGLRAVSTGVDVSGFLRSEEGQRMLASGRAPAAMRKIAADDRAHNDAITRACAEATNGADLVLCTMMMAYRGLCIEAATGVPSRAIYYFPFQATSAWASIVSPVRDLRVGALNKTTARAFHRLLWMQNHASLDEMCSLLGSAPLRRRPRLEDRPSIGAYDAGLARPPDLAPLHEVVGWTSISAAVRQRLGDAAIGEDLAAWLDAGPPPVYFGFGSMPVLDPAKMLRDVIAISARLGVRALVAAGWSDFGSVRGELPDHVYVEGGEVDHDAVLPRCVAAVHHGGSGTTAAVLRAGLPSVAVSVFADQPFWGWRLARAGAGTTLPFKALGADRLAAAVAYVLADERAARARAVGAAANRTDGTVGAADVVDRWLAVGAGRPTAQRGA